MLHGVLFADDRPFPEPVPALSLKRKIDLDVTVSKYSVEPRFHINHASWVWLSQTAFSDWPAQRRCDNTSARK